MKPNRQPDPLVGTTVAGRYDIVRRIGKGGMGTVYELVHRRLGRRFALKALLPELVEDQEALVRFQREADSVARLHHPNIVEIFDWETLEDGSPCIIMEYLRGETLARRIKRLGPLEWRVLGRVADQILSALAVAHEAGIVHRDLKPHNIFLAQDDAGEERVKLLDFGVSKVRDSRTTVTGKQQLLGTPAYMSPEQVEGDPRKIGPATDIWAMGAILFEMASAEMAFSSTSIPSLLYHICHGSPGSLEDARPDAPPAFVKTVARALSRDAVLRITNALHLRRELRSALSPIVPEAFVDGLRAATNDDGLDVTGVRASLTPPPTCVVKEREPVPDPASLSAEDAVPSDHLSSEELGRVVAISVPEAPGAMAHETPGTELPEARAEVAVQPASHAASVPPVERATGDSTFLPWREEAPSQRVESEGAQPRDGALGLESAQVGDSGEFSVALTGSHLRRWMVWLGSLLVVAAIGAIVMFAIARGEKERFAAGGESADAGAVAPKSTTEPAVEPAPLALSAERVKIDFLSTPNTAAVFEGDKQVCVTPCSISRPKGPNKIRLTLKKKGYRDLPVAVTLDRDRVEELTLRRAGSRGAAPARVKIDFASTPAGADVFAGGTQVCTTPCSIEWRRGRRKTAFTLKKEGYRDQSIVVQPGRNRVEKVTLHAVAPPAITEAKIEISFESDPSQAAVFAGRTQVGTTPCTIGWPRGQKEVTFTLKKDGYQNRPVAVRPDRDRTEKVTLRRPRTPPPMYPESEDSP